MTGTTFGSFFLADPGAFPRIVDGEPWGGHQRLIDLPGGPFLITGLSASHADLMDREYASTLSASRPGKGCLETVVLRARPDVFREFDLEGWTYTLDEDSDPDRLRLAALHFMALVPWMGGARAGLWTSVEDSWFQGVIENYLRVIVAYRLLFGGGLLLHSAAVVLDESAYLFVGASGAGKSTLARKALHAGTPVLSDDLNAVTGLSAEPSVAQLPFTGELREQTVLNGPVPLRRILLLKKGDSVVCQPLPRVDAVASIVAAAPFVNHGVHNLDTLMDVVASLTARVPVARLTSARDSSFEEIGRAAQSLQG